MNMKQLRASLLALKAHTRTILAGIEDLEQQVLVAQNSEQKEEKLFQDALLLIKDQQQFIAYLAMNCDSDDMQRARELDDRACTFTFISNFSQAKKEAFGHE